MLVVGDEHLGRLADRVWPRVLQRGSAAPVHDGQPARSGYDAERGVLLEVH